MRFLRTVSTQRLLAIIAGVVIAVVGGTAIAVAASSGGPKPPAESLATALHQAATAPAVTGITARIKFTNNLINTSDIQGADPILNGATGRLWMSNDGRLRLELQGDNGDASVVVNNGAFSIYDPLTNTVYQGTLPQHSSSSSSSGSEPIPTVAQIQSDINQLAQHWNLIGPTPRNVAGQPAYKVQIAPKHDGGLLGQVQLAWDAARGVPLGIAIYSTSSSSPVLELKATSISYGSVPVSDFKVTAPSGAKVVRIATTATSAAANRAHKANKASQASQAHSEVTGAAAVQAHLPFTLAAPNPLPKVGDQLQSVQLLDWGGSPAALVTYGQGLGGIAVIEQSAQGQSSAPSTSSQGAGQQGLSLPSVSIDGATGQELDTALGTAIRFSKGGVEYTVLGSVPPAAAVLAAEGLTSGA